MTAHSGWVSIIQDNQSMNEGVLGGFVGEKELRKLRILVTNKFIFIY